MTTAASRRTRVPRDANGHTFANPGSLGRQRGTPLEPRAVTDRFLASRAGTASGAPAVKTGAPPRH